MPDAPDSLVLDLVEWVALEPRPYADVLDRWRTSCPRLTVWEDALDRGLVKRVSAAQQDAQSVALVVVTDTGEKFLRDSGRAFHSSGMVVSGSSVLDRCEMIVSPIHREDQF